MSGAGGVASTGGPLQVVGPSTLVIPNSTFTSPISLPNYGTLANTAASPSDRQLAVAAANAPLRYTYGLDRIAPLIANALLDSVGAMLVDCVIGEGPIGGVILTEINDLPLPAGVTVTVYDGTQVVADAVLMAAWLLQGIVYADVRPNVAYAVIRIPANVDLVVDPRSIAFTVQGLKCYDPRQNLLIRSEEFDNGIWGKFGTTTVTVNATTAPDGSVTADNVAQTVDSDSIYQDISLVGTVSVIARVCVKGNGSAQINFVLFWFTGGATQNVILQMNPTTGGFIATGSTGATLLGYEINALAAGWYEIVLKSIGTDAANTVLRWQIYNITGGSSAYFVWGGQARTVVSGSAASYVKTLAVSVNPGTAYTNNTALILANFLAHPTRGPGDTIDWNSVGVVAERCDALLANKKRHTFGLTFAQQIPKKDIEETIRAGVCYVVREGGTDFLVADAPVGMSAMTAFNSADWQPAELRVSQRDAVSAPNRITVRYVNTTVKPWGEAYTDSLETADVTNGLVDAVEMVVNATWIQDFAEAVRLRNRYFAEHTLGLRSYDFPVFEKGYKLRRGDVIMLNDDVDTSHLLLDGSATGYASTPSIAATQLVGNFQIRVDVALDNWSVVGYAELVSKISATAGYEFGVEFYARYAVLFIVYFSTTGGGRYIASIPLPAYTPGSRQRFGVTRDSVTGYTNFYTSPDFITWNQLGATIFGTPEVTKADTAALYVGTRIPTIGNLSGKLFRAQVFSVIGGAPIVDFDTSALLSATPTMTGRTGEVWTPNGTAKFVWRLQTSNPGDLIAKAVRVKQITALGFARLRVLAQEYQAAMYSDDTPNSPITPGTNLPDPRTVLPVTAIVMTEEVYLDQLQAAPIASGAKYVSRFRCTWTAPADQYLVDYIVRFLVGTQLIFEGSCIGVEYVSPPVQQSLSYTVEVRARNTLGFKSSPTMKSQIALGKLLIPGPVPRISQAIEIGGEVLLAWDPSVDIDVIRYEWRYTPNSTSGTWESATLIDRVDGLRTRFKGLPVGTHRFYIKPIDSVPQYSTNALYVDITLTSDANAFAQEWEFTNPTLTGIVAFQLEGEQHQRWITSMSGTWATTFASAMSVYSNPIANYFNTHADLFRGEAKDLGSIIAGNWIFKPNVIDLENGTADTYFDTSNDGITYASQASPWAGATRFIRAMIQDTASGAFTIIAPPKITLAAVTRKESGLNVTSSATVATTISLTGKYFKAVRITITPRGLVPRTSTLDNVVLSTSGANSFDVYLFTAAGAQVASAFDWAFEGY